MSDFETTAFSLKDLEKGCYCNPVCYESDVDARRMFRSMCALPNTPRKAFELYRVGFFNKKTGRFVRITPVKLCAGADFTDDELVDTYVEALKGRVNSDE